MIKLHCISIIYSTCNFTCRIGWIVEIKYSSLTALTNGIVKYMNFVFFDIFDSGNSVAIF